MIDRAAHGLAEDLFVQLLRHRIAAVDRDVKRIQRVIALVVEADALAGHDFGSFSCQPPAQLQLLRVVGMNDDFLKACDHAAGIGDRLGRQVLVGPFALVRVAAQAFRQHAQPFRVNLAIRNKHDQLSFDSL